MRRKRVDQNPFIEGFVGLNELLGVLEKVLVGVLLANAAAFFGNVPVSTEFFGCAPE